MKGFNMVFLFHLHSGFRWLVVLATVAALVDMLLLWQSKKEFCKRDSTILLVFTILIDIQASLGIIMLLWMGFMGMGFPMFHIEHGVTLAIAVVLAHMPKLWETSAASVRAKKTGIMILGVILFIAVGVARLPQGW